jgi:hypothetical protein
MRSKCAGLALALLLSGVALAEVKVGDVAPPLEGTKWFTADGKAPELKGKVHVIDFWFAG